MEGSRTNGRRTPWTAALAMLALVAQLLIPVTMAQARTADTIMLCTPQGAVSVTVGHDGQPAKAPVQTTCQHCALVSPAAMPEPAIEVAPVRYAVRELNPAVAVRAERPPARAPPRPPSQGPPIRRQA